MRFRESSIASVCSTRELSLELEREQQRVVALAETTFWFSKVSRRVVEAVTTARGGALTTKGSLDS